MSAIITMGPSSSSSGGMDDPHNDTFDVTIEDVSKYKVGDKVDITISGVIGMVCLPPEVGMGNPKIGVKVMSQDITKVGTSQVDEIRKLVEADLLGGEDPNSEGY